MRTKDLLERIADSLERIENHIVGAKNNTSPTPHRNWSVRGKEGQMENLTPIIEVLNRAKDKGLRGVIIDKAENKLKSETTVDGFIRACPELFVVTCQSRSPFFVSWGPSLITGFWKVYDTQRLKNYARDAQEIWDSIEELSPCKDWFADMIYYKCQGMSGKEALHNALTTSDWEWIRENVKAKHCTPFLKEFIRTQKGTLFLDIFGPERKKVWYDEEFIAALGPIWESMCASPDINSYKQLFEALSNSLYYEGDAMKVPLCEWPKEAIHALHRVWPHHWKRITSPKD